MQLSSLNFLQLLITVDESGFSDKALPHSKRFACLVDQLESPLLRFASKMVGSLPWEAEDFVQEAFIKFHQKVEQDGWDSIEQPVSWLFRVVRNLVNDVARRKQVEKKYLDQKIDHEAKKQNEQLGQLELEIQSETGRMIMSAISMLAEEEREIVILKVINDFNLREIAEITGLKLGTVAYRLNKSLEVLQSYLLEKGVVDFK